MEKLNKKLDILSCKARSDNSLVNLQPWQITGLTDGEGGFYCSILKTGSKNEDKAFRVKLEFKIVQKSHSENILIKIQNYFACGSVVIDNRKTDTKKYHVTALSDIINIIIPHFDKFPCLTSKFLNFSDWKDIAKLMEAKEHLTKEGLEKIREISSKMNTGRPNIDKYNFLSESLGLDSNGIIQTNLPEHWVQTFIDGEGMFYNYIKTEENKVTVDSSMEIAQANHDVLILLAIKQFFNAGYIKPKYNMSSITECLNSRSVNRFIIRDTKVIIDFVNKYPMLTRKQLDFLDWLKIVEIKNKGEHKNPEGIAQILRIKSSMNSKRDEQ